MSEKFWMMDKPHERTPEEAELEKYEKMYEETFGERFLYSAPFSFPKGKAIETIKECIRTKTKQKFPPRKEGVTY